MTLIKFNLENKTNDCRKKEILNKLNKLQEVVHSDKNYNELVYHIITNAALNKKNIKVNLDHYGNYSVIDTKNKIVGGGLFNSTGGNSSVLTPVKNTIEKNTNVKSKITEKSIVSEEGNDKTNSIISKESKQSISFLNTIFPATNSTKTQSIVKQNNNGTDGSKGVLVPTSDVETDGAVETDGSKGDLGPTSDVETDGAKGDQGYTGAVKTDGVVKTDDSIGDQGPIGAVETDGAVKTDDTTGVKGTTDTSDVETDRLKGVQENNKNSWLSRLFIGGKKQTMEDDDSSYPSFQTTLFHEDSEDLFMDHVKNMSSKKYLRSLTVQELKDIMKSNQMNVTHNGAYYNKDQMVNKIYQFYK